MSIRLFKNNILNVKITTVVNNNGKIYFKAKDVEESLEYKRPANAIERHVWNENKFRWDNIQGSLIQKPSESVWEEDRFRWNDIRGTVNQRTLLNVVGLYPQTLFLTEPGAYQLAFCASI